MKKFLLPKPIYVQENNGSFLFENPALVAENCDCRVIKAIDKLYETYGRRGAESTGTFTVCHGTGTDEAYSLSVTEGGIAIHADSPAGAFYAVQTLKQLLKQGRELPCLEIHDKPEFEHRGFYHDVTRGRMPTVQTLKGFIDTLAEYKINSLQLYMEHSFAFEEYKDFNANQEPYTEADIIELDEYCKENFIDLIPSLSCFGHLYELLQLEEYQHLCELENFVPNDHFWRERMFHHTIDATNPESVVLIKSMIDRYVKCFSSKYFNICCDETFDLGKGRNSGKPLADLYIGFVSQIIRHLEEKGKTVMLWADVVHNHLDEIDKISKDAILLNWEYGSDVDLSKFKKLADLGRTQISCPCVWGHKRLIEYLPESIANIRKVAAFSKICNAKGILNTYWGDFGHFCSPLNVGYSTILGAVESWCPVMCEDEYFDAAISALHYSNPDGQVVSAMKSVSRADEVVILSHCFLALGYPGFEQEGLKTEKLTAENMDAWIAAHQNAAKVFENALSSNAVAPDLAKSLLLAANGYVVLLQGLNRLVNGKKYDNWEKEFTVWTALFCEDWLRQNRKDELYHIVEFFNTFKDAVLKKA